MFNRTRRIGTYLVVAVAALVLAGPLATDGRADFVLWNDEEFTVNTSHSLGAMYDTSQADIVSSGSVDYLYAYGTATVDISGRVKYSSKAVGCLYAYDTATVDISGRMEYSSHAVSNLYVYDTATVTISGWVSCSAYSASNLRVYDTSTVTISDGLVYFLYVYDTATVDISGGSVPNLYVYDIRPFGQEQVTISGGNVRTFHVNFRLDGGDHLTISESSSPATLAPHGILVSEGTVASFREYISAYDTSTVAISGGSVYDLRGYDTSAVNITGGSVAKLYAYDTSTVTLLAHDFRLGGGLSLDGDRVLGTGILSGEWSDGTRWVVNIASNAPGATIRAVVVPEPATLALLALGGLGVLGRAVRRRGLGRR